MNTLLFLTRGKLLTIKEIIIKTYNAQITISVKSSMDKINQPEFDINNQIIKTICQKYYCQGITIKIYFLFPIELHFSEKNYIIFVVYCNKKRP